MDKKEQLIKEAKDLFKTGNEFYNKNKYEKAIEYYKRALSIFESVEMWSEYVGCLNSISTSLWIKRKLDESMKYAEKAIKTIQEKDKNNYKQLFFAYKNIGTIFYFRGKYTKAVDYFFKASNITEKAFGKNSLQLAAIHSNLGAVYNNLGDMDNATDYLEKSIDIYIERKGKQFYDLVSYF